MELENVVVNHGAAVMNWDLPGLGERALSRCICRRTTARFTIVGRQTSRRLCTTARAIFPPALDNFNVYLMTVSPPDEYGYCNFGEAQIMSKLLAQR